MRPPGCQETDGRAAAAARRCNLQISNQFLSATGLTLRKTGTYTEQVKTRARIATWLLASAALALPAAPVAQALQRAMYVSALGADGSPVADLSPSDLMVREDNVPREVLRVGPADDPMQIAVLVDNSRAARNYIRDIRTGLEGFVTEMTNGTKHELSIVSLGERPTILSDASSDREKILKGVFRIFDLSDSGNYLLDGIIEVSKGFAKREARRPVIVALTTEGPEFSSRQWEDVLRPLGDVGAAFHALVLGPPSNGIGEDARNRAAVLDQGPRLTGGRRETLLATSALPGALKKLAAELKQQYRVVYARPPALIPPRKITVSAARAGLTVRGTPIPEKKDQGRP